MKTARLLALSWCVCTGAVSVFHLFLLEDSWICLVVYIELTGNYHDGVF